MALGFPTSPGNGDTFTLSGVTYTYNSTHGVWQIKPPPGTNLTNTPSATTVLLTSSTGTATTLPAATTTTAGVMVAADKTKLDALPADAAAFTEAVQDAAAAMVTSAAHAGVITAYNDAANTLTIAVDGTNATFIEAVQDAAAAMVTAGTHTGITTTYDDANGKLSLVVTDTNLALGTATATTQLITNSRGTGFTLPAVTTTAAGLQSALDKTKLDVVPAFYTWLKKEAADPWNMADGAITYNANDATTTYNVVWADGSTGVFTATAFDANYPSEVNAYTITYVPAEGHPYGNKTITQPAVTRDALGRITNRPARTVA